MEEDGPERAKWVPPESVPKGDPPAAVAELELKVPPPPPPEAAPAPEALPATDVVVSTGFLERFLPRCMCRSQYF